MPSFQRDLPGQGTAAARRGPERLPLGTGAAQRLPGSAPCPYPPLPFLGLWLAFARVRGKRGVVEGRRHSGTPSLPPPLRFSTHPG